MNKWKVALGAALMAGCGATAAHAGVITYNTSLASPGVYYGAGNPNSNFTVDTESNGIELGLEAVIRFAGAVTPTSTNIYNVPTGAGPGGNGVWGTTFSINLGASGFNLSTVVPILSVIDVVNGTNGGFDLRLIPDNGNILANGTTQSNCAANVLCLPTDIGLQNSESLTFASIKAAISDPLYSNLANDTFFISLNVYGVGTGSCGTNAGNTCGSLLATNTIQVNQGLGATASAVPEPATVALFGAGIMGLGAMRRRRKARVS